MTAQILVPLDGSPLAEQALACSMTLGWGLPAELVLFRAVSIPPDTREVLDDAGLETAALMEQLEAEANDCQVPIAYVSGSLIHANRRGGGIHHWVYRGQPDRPGRHAGRRGNVKRKT